jgi:hypothetical protein
MEGWESVSCPDRVRWPVTPDTLENNELNLEPTMKKPVLGIVLGGALGIFDGLSALISAPEVAPGIVGIVIGSTIKGILVGVIAGWFARKVDSVPAGIAVGLLVGAALAYAVAAMQGQYYLEIMLPGSILGVIVGYATQRYGSRPLPARA